MCLGELARHSQPSIRSEQGSNPPPCSWVGLPPSWPTSLLFRVPVVLIRTTSNEGTYKKRKENLHHLLLAVVLQMVCLPPETIFIALSGHDWVSIKASFSSHNRVFCFGFEYKRLHNSGGKISVPCLKLHTDDSDTQKGSLVSRDPLRRPGLSVIYVKQITDVPGETALFGAEHLSLF